VRAFMIVVVKPLIQIFLQFFHRCIKLVSKSFPE